MFDQKGFMGCGNLMIITWLLFMLIFGSLIIISKKIFYETSEESVLTSTVAARRCRKKLEAFKTNDYIKSISLNELEINSALHEEFSQGQHQPFMSVIVEMGPENLKLNGYMVYAELIPQKLQALLGVETKKRKKDEPPRLMAIKMTCQPVIKEQGKLFLNPQELYVGKQRFPVFIVSIMNKIKPSWFNYPIFTQITEVEVSENKLELIKG